MCGIAGYFGRRAIGEAARATMFAALARRGPDAAHFSGWDDNWRPTPNGDCARGLLSTRLAIRDPRPLADQPMANERGDLWLCYNGEVYGWENEARALGAAGVPFRTHCDSEFILRGYEAWGLDGLLPRLRGMFAFAILDLRRAKLLLARDRLGLKPLLYYYRDGEFAFGSVARALLPYLPDSARRFAPEAIDAYLAHRYIPAPLSIFGALERLENAHALEFDLASGALAKRCYWRPRATDEAPLQDRLDEAVELRTVADRPVGVFLSGGVDSSVVTSRLAAQGFGNVRTFTASLSDPSLDEAAGAARIAQQLGMPNTAVAIPDDLSADFATIVADFDEPFADPSSFPLWYLARETTKSVKVVLTGDGGDELFAGYKRYGQHLRSAWRAPLPSAPALGGRAQLVPGRAARLGEELALDWVEAYGLRFSGFSPAQRRALAPDFASRRAVYWRGGEAPAKGTPLDRLLAIDFDNYLPEYILRKADLMTMAHGLEARAPLLDHRFVERVVALPAAERFTRPAKRALAPFCAPCTALGLLTQKKRGFNPPVARLIAGLAERLAGLGARLAGSSNGHLDAKAVDTFVGAYARQPSLAEQVLQLLILDESLLQLSELGRAS